MARRVLGGGRVLGSGKNLSPATASSTPSPQPKGRLSPSPSSVSLDSQASASPYSPDIQDLTSRISLDNGETSISAAPAATGAQLACPICNEEMVTLLQLNRHLDDAHQNLEEVKQDEVKDWFKAQMDKAKRFQPLAVLNQKLKGLDVFESNENAQPPSIAIARQAPGPVPVEAKLPDPDEVITREHWQPRGPYDICCEPSCGKRLTSTNGSVNCRKCGLIRDHTEEFAKLRKPTIDKAFLEVSRLEKRLARLTQALANLPADQIQSGAIGLAVASNPQREITALSTLFSRRDFDEERLQKPPIARSYDNLVQFERGIRLLQPRFQKLLTALQDPHNPPTPAQLAEASKVRKRLIDSFAQYDTAARRIRDLPTDSPNQQKLQRAIYQQASNFLHLHMLPLKSLPKILKHATPGGRPLPNGHSRNILHGDTSPPAKPFTPALASIKYGNNAPNGSSQSINSDNSSAISALEDEEKSLRDRLIVLEEQKFFVSEMIADANRRRKFDEVSALALNVEDLSKEIDRINGILNNMDFESLYTGNAQI
uniref:Vacuolar segregation protein pep7 n=1 Tax=Talaromyces marneffei PM1 TaxID=1077442 RepID=A0A093VUX0_TALMA